MPHNRFFTPQPLCADQTVALDPQESLHVQKVMRLKPQDRLELINGQGYLAIGTLLDSRPKQAQIYIHSVTIAPKPPSITLVLAILEPKRLELVIEKATELGVTDFILFRSKQSTPKTYSLERLHTHMQHALKQSGNLFLPRLETERDPFLTPVPHSAYGSIDPAAPSLLSLPKCTTLWIGPEKGFTSQEITMMESIAIQKASLSPHILRAETAAIAGSCLLMAKNPTQVL